MERYYLILKKKNILIFQLLWTGQQAEKRYSKCGKNDKWSSNYKTSFCNKLQLISPLKPTNNPSINIKICEFDVMIVLSLIPIRNRSAAIIVYGMGWGSTNIFRKSAMKHTICCLCWLFTWRWKHIKKIIVHNVQRKYLA